MPSNIKTPNIGLNQWIGSEYPKRQDFVDDNLKIDNEIQSLKDEKSDLNHTHNKSQITDFAHTHDKNDISNFAHTHSKDDITDFSHVHKKADISDFAHTHSKSEISDFPTVSSSVTSTSTSTLANSNAAKIAYDKGVEALGVANTKANSSHTHTMGDITGLELSSTKVTRPNGKTVEASLEANETSILELKQSVSSGKQKVATAITDKGVSTGSDASFDTMASNIGLIKVAKGSAVAANVLSGKTFTNDSGQLLTGTMANRAGTTACREVTDYNGSLYYKIDLGAYITPVGLYPEVYATYSQLEAKGFIKNGKKFASGTAETYKISAYNYGVQVSGLTFKPSIIFVHGTSSYSTERVFGCVYRPPMFEGRAMRYKMGSGVASISADLEAVGGSTSDNYYVINGGFRLHSGGSYSQTVSWLAFE